MHFEWDPAKAVGNADKHGVAFEEACTVFADPLSATQENRFGGELRFITVGYSATGRLLLVVHTDRDDAIRIISARPATAAERKRHEESV